MYALDISPLVPSIKFAASCSPTGVPKNMELQ
jgi:hypothetical protein